MSLISDLEVEVQDRLEEARDGVGVFWKIQDELRPLIVEAMNVATIITGEPEIRPMGATALFTVQPNQTFQAMPAGALAILRVESAGQLPIKKVRVVDLDRMFWQWENAAPSDSIQAWFPFGLTQWGVYPQIKQSIQLLVSYVGFPVNVARPYTGLEAIPFQDEYRSGFSDYAAHAARLKEGGVEFDQSVVGYDRFLVKLQQLSRYAMRKGILRFTFAPGSAGSGPTDVRGS